MGTAAGAAHLGAHHPKRAVLNVFDRIRSGRFIKRWPPAVGFKFGARLKQFVATRPARINADPVLMQEFTGPGALSCCLTLDRILSGTEFFAPLFISLGHFILRGIHDGPLSLAGTFRYTPLNPSPAR